MATARKLPSGSWRCQVYSHTETIQQPDGTTKQKRIYKSFTCDDPSPKGKRKVEKEAAAWAVDKERATHTDKTFGEALDDYIKGRSDVLSPATIREYKRTRKHDLKGIMDLKIDNITQQTIQSVINQEALSHSPKTVANMHGLISAVFSVYRPNFQLHTTLPKKQPANLYIPTDDDIKRLIEQVEGTVMEVPVLLAAFGPMRRGEICALRAENIKGNIVHVCENMVQDENRNWVIKTPKSRAGDRYIEFPPFVIDRITIKAGRITSLNPNMISSRFSHVLKAAGIEHFKFHALRHYSASIQHALGIPDVYIMQRGGWGNDGVLKSVYRHVLSDKQAEMNRMANDHFCKIVQSCNTKCNTN